MFGILTTTTHTSYCPDSSSKTTSTTKITIKSKYSLQNKAKDLINNDKLSDVCFLVGDPNDNQEKIYAHKLILSMGSPVFETMFYGSLAEKNGLIKIPDLSPVGFLSIIRYIYGDTLDFDLIELYDMYVAGNKYMVYDLCDAIRNCLNDNLNDENKALIYEQLVKIRAIDQSIGNDLLNIVRNSIDKSAFNNSYFNMINEETLIDLLSMEYLEVDEFEILKACINWINLSQPIEDRKTKSKLLIPYIKFSRLTFDNLKHFKKLDSFLTNDEIASLFLFLVDPVNRPYPFESKTARKQLLSFDFWHPYTGYSFSCTRFCFLLTVTEAILLRSIDTILPPSLESFQFKFALGNKRLETNVFKAVKDNTLTLVFPRNFLIRPNLTYHLELSFDEIYYLDAQLSSKISSVLEMNNGETKFVCTLNNNPHCIRKINFFATK